VCIVNYAALCRSIFICESGPFVSTSSEVHSVEYILFYFIVILLPLRDQLVVVSLVSPLQIIIYGFF